MKIRYNPIAIRAFAEAPSQIQKAFLKQAGFLVQNLHHPSLHAKKYDEARDRWQARVNRDWRFYFTIEGDTYVILDMIPHPRRPARPSMPLAGAKAGLLSEGIAGEKISVVRFPGTPT